jgi:hypothetical protein
VLGAGRCPQLVWHDAVGAGKFRRKLFRLYPQFVRHTRRIPGHTLKADKAVHSTARSHDSVSCALGLSRLRLRTGTLRNTSRRAAGPAEDAPAASFAPPAGTPPPRPTARTRRGSSAAGEAARAGVCWVVVERRPPYPLPGLPAAFRIENSTSETSHVWTSVPRPPKKNPNVRRLYDVPTRDAACRTRDGFIADRETVWIFVTVLYGYRASMVHRRCQTALTGSRSRAPPQTPSRRAGCGSLMWAALSMSICVIILGGVLRLAEAAAAAVA